MLTNSILTHSSRCCLLISFYLDMFCYFSGKMIQNGQMVYLQSRTRWKLNPKNFGSNIKSIKFLGSGGGRRQKLGSVGFPETTKISFRPYAIQYDIFAWRTFTRVRKLPASGVIYSDDLRNFAWTLVSQYLQQSWSVNGRPPTQAVGQSRWSGLLLMILAAAAAAAGVARPAVAGCTLLAVARPGLGRRGRVPLRVAVARVLARLLLLRLSVAGRPLR